MSQLVKGFMVVNLESQTETHYAVLPNGETWVSESTPYTNHFGKTRDGKPLHWEPAEEHKGQFIGNYPCPKLT